MDEMSKKIKQYESIIKLKAQSFFIINSMYKGKSKSTEEQSLGVTSAMTVEDIQQELRISVWESLVNYREEESHSEYGKCSMETFVWKNLNKTMGMLASRLWADYRGHGTVHDSDSILLTGEYSDDV